MSGASSSLVARTGGKISRNMRVYAYNSFRPLTALGVCVSQKKNVENKYLKKNELVIEPYIPSSRFDYEGLKTS